eukprot:682574-Prymnesium_polylepis.1
MPFCGRAPSRRRATCAASSVRCDCRLGSRLLPRTGVAPSLLRELQTVEEARLASVQLALSEAART